MYVNPFYAGLGIGIIVGVVFIIIVAFIGGNK